MTTDELLATLRYNTTALCVSIDAIDTSLSPYLPCVQRNLDGSYRWDRCRCIFC